jgi:glycosyltransferase involved in cell wall biosynthesis
LPQQRARVRHEWGIRDDEILIGRAARLAPMKDYPAFFKAAGLVYRQQPNVRFACVGDGTDCAELFQLAAAEGLEERMTWAGGRRDMPAVYNALDICVSSSRFSEGFPNTVAEAMACGTPCVATRTGDSEQIVGDMGIIVPPCDAALLADGITRLLATLHSHPRERVRARIVSHFSLERLTSRTAAEFETVLIQ